MSAVSVIPAVAANPSLPPAATGPPAQFPVQWQVAIVRGLQELVRPAASGGTDLPQDGNALPPDPAWLPLPAMLALPPATPSREVSAAVGAIVGAPGEAAPAPAGGAEWVASVIPEAASGRAAVLTPPPAAARVPAAAVAAIPADAMAETAAEPVGAAPASTAAAAAVGLPDVSGRSDREPLPPPVSLRPPKTALPLAVTRAAGTDAVPKAAAPPVATGDPATTGPRVDASAAAAAAATAIEDPDVATSGKAPVSPPAAAVAGAAPGLSPPQPSGPAVVQLPVTVGSERFGDALGERVLWMVDRDLNSARLTLNPPQLGPLEVRVQVSGDQASVSFTAHNFVTRDALEQAVPRLRDMLGAQGFTHVDVNVAHHSFSERSAQPARYAGAALARNEAPGPVAAQAAGRQRPGATLLDAYA
jgi:flagellar hook-length control protein FliK